MTVLRPLRDADADCGAKAGTLGTLLRAGFAVPPGLVVMTPDGIETAALREALLRSVGPGPYAVRSSALGEDGCHASFAGQLHTSLGPASVTEVVEAIARTAGSAGAQAPVAYAARLGVPAPAAVPVIVQQLVAAESAGVLFTRDPVTGEEETTIEATPGRGDRLVDAEVTPERWVVRGEAPRLLHEASESAVLTLTQARDLSEHGRRIEALLGTAQDVEWAIADDRVWILQARPITTGTSPAAMTGAIASDAVGDLLLTGTPASPGVASGATRIVTGLDQFASLGPGDVLVCRTTSPAWTPLLARAGAVVTEIGGLLSHAAIVAREFGIPAVLGAEGALSSLAGTTAVAVDGTRGVVRTVPAGMESAGTESR